MRMTVKTKKATIASAEKWRRIIIDPKAKDKGGLNCELCGLFSADNCIGCPVRIKTGLPHCRGTSYYEWRNSAMKTEGVIEDTYYRGTNNLRASRCAREMFSLINNLLPVKDRL